MEEAEAAAPLLVLPAWRSKRKHEDALAARAKLPAWARDPVDARNLHVQQVCVAISMRVPVGHGHMATEHAVVSFYPSSDGDVVIQGMDRIDSFTTTEMEVGVLAHMRRLVVQPHLREAEFVVAIENNLGQEADHLATMIKATTPRVRVLRQSELREGVRITRATRMGGDARLKQLFAQDRVKVDRNVFCNGSLLAVLADLSGDAFEGRAVREALQLGVYWMDQ
jgi:hypothetical protein